MRHLKLIIAAAALTLLAVSAQAQTQAPYPDRDPTTREALDTGTF